MLSSGMVGYELHGHLSEQLFRAIGGYFANFSRSVARISEKTYSQQAVYLSYTSQYLAARISNVRPHQSAVILATT